MTAQQASWRYPSLKTVAGALFLICWMLWLLIAQHFALRYQNPSALPVDRAVGLFMGRFAPCLAIVGTALVVADVCQAVAGASKKWFSRIP